MGKTKKNSLGMIVSTGVLLCVLAGYILLNTHTLFGIYVPRDMADNINAWLGYGLLAFAIWLHYQRRNPDKTKILRGLSTYIAFALIVVGWRFAAGDTTLITFSNDGYTVTGGFMMLAGGFELGYLISTTPKKDKK